MHFLSFAWSFGRFCFQGFPLYFQILRAFGADFRKFIFWDIACQIVGYTGRKYQIVGYTGRPYNRSKVGGVVGII